MDLKAFIRDVPNFPIKGVIFRDITPLLRSPAAFVPARKPGKLPWRTIREQYQLEYGGAALEMHEDAIRPGQRVVIVDDVIATGGALNATRRLVERLGGTVEGMACLMALTFLNGRWALEAAELFSVLAY